MGAFSLIWMLVGIGLLLAPIVALIIVMELRQRVRMLERRLQEMERDFSRVPPRSRVEPGAPRVVPAPPPEPAAAAVHVPETAPDVEPEPAGAGPSWSQLEARLGGTWLNRVGALVLVLGIGFFLKYAFDNSWIGPSGRVALGILTGVGLLLLGERMQRAAYRVPAQGVAAAGIATLYMSAYAAYALYDLVSQASAFAFMVLVTATGMALAIHHDARVIAVLANVGGFLTPVVLASNRDAAIALFTYLAILDAGMLASAYWRRWRELQVLSLVFTQALYWAWFDRWYQPIGLDGPPQRAVALIAASVFFALFALVGPVQAAGGRFVVRLDRLWHDTSLLILAAPVAYFVAARAILYPELKTWLGLLCLVLAAFYLLVGRWAMRSVSDGAYLALFHLAIALAFLTLTFPVQFGRHGVTIAWSVEGAALLWGGFRLGAQKLRLGALAILALALLRWLTIATGPASHGGALFADSPALLPTLFFVAAVAAASLLYGRRDQAVTGREIFARPALIVIALGSGALFATMELNQHPTTLPSAYVSIVTTLVWVAAAIPMLALAPGDRTLVLPGAATLLLIAVGLMAMTVNVDAWRRVPLELARPVLNLRFLSGLVIAAVYAVYAGVAPRLPVAADALRARLGAIAGAAAGLFLLWHLSEEISLMPLEGWPAGDAWKIRNMGLSILWTVYAFVAMGVGIRRNQAYLRTGAIGLFALTVVKVFLVDLSRLDAVYRILSFLVLGGVLLLVSFLYTKYRGRISEGAS